MLYAGYYNLAEANKAQAKSSKDSSRNTSVSSTESKDKIPSSRRSSIKKVLDSLRPTEQTLTPAGIYRPVIQNGPLFSRKKSEEWKKMSRWEKNAAVADQLH